MELYNHQIDAAERLKPGSILVGGVGSGKSRTALYFYHTTICRGKIRVNDQGDYSPPKIKRPLYIITTARKRDSREWEKELLYLLIDESEVVIDSWNNIKKYVNVSGAFFIFDEQRVCGYGEWTKSFLKITKNNLWILLSATPADVWLDFMPVFIANGFYKNKTEFIARHVIFSPHVNYPKVDRYVDIERLIACRKKVLVTMNFKRYTKSIKHVINVEYDVDTTNYIFRKRKNPFNDNLPILNSSEFCYSLRRVVNQDPSRCAAIEKILSEHPKAIIFYNFNYELDVLRVLLDSMHFTYSEWNGQKHEEIPKTDSWAFLVQYNAGAEGWNCIETDTIIFYSLNYSYRIMTQAAGRIDRLNTLYHDLHYYYISSNSPIDKAINLALKNKQNFNENRFFNKKSVAHVLQGL